MPVSNQSKQYTDNLERWQRVRDCVEGEDAIKKRSAGGDGSNGGDIWALKGTKYLPPPNPTENTVENKLRFNAYRDRASYKNFTGATLEGLKGMVFRRPPIMELPDGLDYLNENATGSGLTLSQLAQRTLEELSVTGGEGYLVDYPTVGEGITQSDFVNMGLGAHIKSYNSESIINVRTEIVNGKEIANLIVLKEMIESDNGDDFGGDCVEQYRVLRIVENVYIQELYDKDENLIQIDDQDFIVPKQHDGKTWDFIPFIFVGADNNDYKTDKALLLDIANLNLAHYRNSADYEESCFITGQPTLVLSGLNQSWVDDVLGGQVKMGSRGGIPLPEGGSAQLLQANPNQMPLEGMRQKQQEMIALGARIIQDSKGNETAEAAKIRFAGQNSKLAIAVNNIESALIKAVEYCGLFVGVDTENSVIELNRQFYDATIDPQQIAQQIQLLDRNAIAMSDLRHNLRKANMISFDRSDEDIDGEASEVSPLV